MSGARPPLRETSPRAGEQASGPAGERFYYPELDGLRAAAFLAVFAFHALAAPPAILPARAPAFSAAWWASSAVIAAAFSLDLFFVFSGFLITALLLREKDARATIDVRAFWIRRALRIWPLYFAFLALAAVVEGLPWRFVLGFGVFLGNWALIAWPLDRSVTAPLWSVSVEEQFYLAWPLILAAVPRRRVPWLCLGMIAVGLATRALLLADGRSMNEVWIATFSRLDAIAVGALVAWRWGGRPAPLGPTARAAMGAGAVLLLVVTVGFLWHGALDARGMRVHARDALGAQAYAVVAFVPAALACGALLVSVLGARPAPLVHPAAVYLGRISYGMYVWHMAAFHVLEPVWWPARVPLAFALTLGAAAASYRWLERPFLRLKERFTVVRSVPLDGPGGGAGPPAAAA